MPIEQFLAAIDFDFHQVQIRFPCSQGYQSLGSSMARAIRRVFFPSPESVRFHFDGMGFAPVGLLQGAFDGQFFRFRRLRTQDELYLHVGMFEILADLLCVQASSMPTSPRPWSRTDR